MSPAAGRVVVVGGGILGTMHALEAVRRGFQVVHLERDLTPRGASVRNFGLVWVSGRAPGAELRLALEARDRWEAVAREVPGTGFRPAGSLTLAQTEGELAVLEVAATAPEAEARGVRLLDPSEVLAAYPAVRGRILGALSCERDAVVEPRHVLGALRDHLEASGSYLFLPGREARDLLPHAVVDQSGNRFEADLVVCCPGARPGGVLGDALASAPLRPVRLQMLETAPFHGELPCALADGDSLRYYPAYAAGPLDALQPQREVAAAWRAQLLLVRRASGRLTIGDTHEATEPFPFDLDEAPARHLLEAAEALLGSPPPPVARRWAGIYSETTLAGACYLRNEVAPGVLAVTGPGGRGMTLAPAIARETFR